MEVKYGRTDCTPEETGYDSERLEVLDRRLGEMIGREIIHGAAYCILHKGRVIAHRALGSGSAAGSRQMQPDTVFGAASLTKVFTAAAIMQLVEDGLIRLDTRAGEIIPQLSRRPFEDITLLHLLTHSSGLYPDSGCFGEAVPSQWELISAAAEKWEGSGAFDWITPALSAGLRRRTGTEWQYCSFGFTLLGEVISRVSGMNAQEYIMQRIVSPLGMKDSGFALTPETARRAFAADSDEEEFYSSVISGSAPQVSGIWSQIPDTAGGLYTTVYDLIRFAAAILGGGRLDGRRILGRKAAEKMCSVQLSGVPDHCWSANEPNRLYGIGFDIRRTPSFTYSDNTVMHEGAGASSLDIDLDEQLAAAWFVPFDKPDGGWSAEPLYNVQNIIWSGLI